MATNIYGLLDFGSVIQIQNWVLNSTVPEIFQTGFEFETLIQGRFVLSCALTVSSPDILGMLCYSGHPRSPPDLWPRRQTTC